nr:EOG090X0CZM [Macrothrix elegans]
MFKPQNTVFFLRTLGRILQQNSYSMYPPTFQEPLYDPKRMEQAAQSGEIQKLKFLPIKAAKNDQSVSMFHDDLKNKFINMVMEKGHKVVARNLVETAFMRIKQIQLAKYYNATTDEEKAAIECDPLTIFHKAIENCKPVIQLTPVKRGGATYQVPVPITDHHARFMAMKWMIVESREKDRKVRFHDKLANELLDAYNNTGKVVKRKQDLHRQCEANRAYAHYRWG